MTFALLMRMLLWTAIFCLTAELDVQAQEGGDVKATFLSNKEGNDGLIFCAYNVRNYLKMNRHKDGVLTPGSGKAEAEIAVVIQSLIQIKADVLGLCEVGDEEDALDLQRRLREAGLDYPHYELSHGGDRTRSLLLLSRWPIVNRQSQKLLLYDIGGQMFPMQRGILDVSIQLGERSKQQIRFIGVHFKSKRVVPEADEMLMRRNEAHLLREHINQVLAGEPDARLLVYGDFNEHAHEAPMRDVQGIPGSSTALKDIKMLDTRSQSWTHYWEYADVYSRFDYILVNQVLAKKVDATQCYIYDVPHFMQGSDHRPIVVKLRGL